MMKKILLSITILALLTISINQVINIFTEAFAQKDTSTISQKSTITSRLNAFGWDSYKKGKLEEAIYFFKKTLNIDPANQEAIYGLSWSYYKQKKFDKAAEGFKKLFKSDYKKSDVAIALFLISLKKKDMNQAKYYYSFLPKDTQKKYSFLLKRPKKKSKRVVKRVKKKPKPNTKLNNLFKVAKEKKWNECLKIIDTLPEKDKNRADVLKIAAWAYYNTNQPEKAKTIFLRLYEKDPKNPEIIKALSLCAFKTKDESLISKLLKENKHNKQLLQFRCDLLSQKILKASNNKNYDELISAYESFLNAGCEDKDHRNRELLAWSYFKKGDYNTSYKIFSDLDILGVKRASVKEGLMESLLALGDERQAWILADKLKNSSDKKDREIAANFYYRQNLPKVASFIDKNPLKPYYNAHSHFGSLKYNYVYIDGDSGTSKLYYQEIPKGELYYRAQENLGVGLGLINVLLQSGPIGERPWLGTPYLKDTITSAHSSVSGFVPYLYVEFEDKWRVDASISSTPIGGPVGAMPTFDFSYSDSTQTKSLSVFQRPVPRSMLSWVGQKDPYTKKYWGRVLSTGIEGAFKYDLKPLWISINARYSHLWGKNIWDNNEYSAGISLGKSTKTTYLSDFSYGIFAHFMHFDNNSNFYTYGHGGYFSPQFFVATGPFVHLSTKPGEKWLIEFDGALSYLNFYEEGSPFYPETKGLSGDYSSEHSSKIGYSAHLSTGYLIRSNIMLQAHAGINKSADFTQWHMGIGLKIFLEPRKGLLNFDILSRMDSLFQ